MSQAKQILRYLRSGNSLTQAQSVRYFGCYRLSARIFDLRKMGILIHSEIIRHDGSNFAKYSLA